MTSSLTTNPGAARRIGRSDDLGHNRYQAGNSSDTGDSSKARLFLAIACIWPLCLLALFASSAPHLRHNHAIGSTNVLSPRDRIRNTFRDALDRVDIMGYGPTHPRLAIVLVGDALDGNVKENLVSSLESIFSNTDLNRIFVVCVIVDGLEKDPQLVQELQKIDIGAIPHWHGMRPDFHANDTEKHNDEAEDDPHGKKVHVIFSGVERMGLTQSRKDAVEFIKFLELRHEKAGLKSDEEDLILLLLQSGSRVVSRKWLEHVTNALIVPPPILGRGDHLVALKLANAVSFNLEGSGKCTSFDTTFTPRISDANAADITLSNGASYPTPAFNGAAIAMRLDTYLDLPMQDVTLTEAWPANLDLALNLWLCADGIDILKDVEVTTFQRRPVAPMTPEMAARFAAAWMDESTQYKFYLAYTQTFNTRLSYLDWETLQAKARSALSFTQGLSRKCRSFMWYVENINTDLNLNVTEKIIQPLIQTVSLRKKLNSALSSQIGNNSGISDATIPRQGKEMPGIGKNVPRNKTEADEENDISIPARFDKLKPSKPLCEECIRIVQLAQTIDIKFENIRMDPPDHPHMGARDSQGKLGYVHNETSLRENPPTFNFTGPELQSACERRDNNWKMLHEKVFVDMEYDQRMEKSGKDRAKIFCLVYTTDIGHDRIPAIRETWGPKCDGFMVGSNRTDESIDAVDIPHKGEEAYGNIWQKVRSMWAYVYDNYYEKYDWFHIGGDDLFLIAENLRLYLESEEIRAASNGGIYLPDGTETVQTPLFLGRRFAYMGDMQDIFNSGGSGYTMNKAALKTLVVKGFPKFAPNAVTFSEDTMVARVLREYGIFPYETKDEAGGERYMPFMPGHHYGYRIPEDHETDWYAKYSINIKEGVDHCAARSVAFHYVKGDSMRRLYALLYKLCPVDLQ